MNIDSHIYSFQYRLITCYVLLLISLTVFAQSGKERFSGRVIDTETYQPVPFATVRLLALPDSTLLGGGATVNFNFPFPFLIMQLKRSLYYYRFHMSDISRFFIPFPFPAKALLTNWGI